MLFWAKRDARTAVGAAVALVAAAVAAQRPLGVSWNRVFDPTGVVVIVVLGLGVVILSDSFGYVALWLAFDDEFLAVFEAFVDYFEDQSNAAIIAGGVLAGAEEFVFRGIVLEVLHRSPAVPTAVAVGVAALAFGAFHVTPDRRLHPFALWAIWEGLLLGGVYAVTGSLIVVVAVHAAHDVIRFTLFDHRRNRKAPSSFLVEPKRE